MALRFRRKRRPEQLRLEGTFKRFPIFGRVARGAADFIAAAAAAVVVAILAGVPAAVGVAVALLLLPLPYDPPWDWVPGGVWHWLTTWVAFGGVVAAVGAWAGNRAYRWLEGDQRGPRLSPRRRYALGSVCLVLLGVGFHELAQSLEEDGAETLSRKAIDADRVCRHDPDLPPPVSGEGVRLYDTNGNGHPDVAVGRPAKRERWTVVIDTAENGLWPSSGYCAGGEFHSGP